MTPVAEPISPPRTKKKLQKRAAPEHSQILRRSFQAAFLLLNVWIGVEFYLWVRYWETGGRTVYATRPPGVEGWLPIASLMNLKAWILTGEIPRLHPAGMFILIAFLAISWLFRKVSAVCFARLERSPSTYGGLGSRPSGATSGCRGGPISRSAG